MQDNEIWDIVRLAGALAFFAVVMVTIYSSFLAPLQLSILNFLYDTFAFMTLNVFKEAAFLIVLFLIWALVFAVGWLLSTTIVNHLRSKQKVKVSVEPKEPFSKKSVHGKTTKRQRKK